jgi:hypothetical protein
VERSPNTYSPSTDGRKPFSVRYEAVKVRFKRSPTAQKNGRPTSKPFREDAFHSGNRKPVARSLFSG